MPFRSRLLIAMDALDPDIHLIRYASMVVRLASLEQSDRVHATWSVHPQDDDGPELPCEENEPLASDGGFPEVRFVYLLPKQKPNELAPLSRERLHKQLQKYFTGLSENVIVGCDLLKGRPFRRLSELVDDFDSDMLLATDSPKFRHNSARLAMEAACSVWLVPPGWAPVLRRVLVPVDFTPRSARCLRMALELMRDAPHAKCMPLHVYHHEARIIHEEYDKSMRRNLAEQYDAFVAPIDAHGVTVEPMFIESHRIDRAIARAAHQHGADLVIMSTRGRSPAAEFIAPSITQSTILESRTSFLVMKTSAKPPGMWRALWDRLRAADDIHFS